MSDEISIELVFAAPERQVLKELRLKTGATIADAIAASGIADDFPQYDLLTLPAGIWGHLADADQTLRDGDRIEIYRELLLDPMESRRLKASEPDPDPR